MNVSTVAQRTLAAALVAVALSACAPWSESISESVSGAQTLVPDGWQHAESTLADNGELAQWWGQFGDPVLTELIEQALVSNNTIAAAEGRLRSARAAYSAAQGARLPSVGASGRASRQESVAGPDLEIENYSLGVDVAWEADIFGKLRGSAAAAAATVQGSEVSLYDIQRLITSDIALSYITVRDAQARLAIARDNLATQAENLQIVQWRNEAGLGSQLEVEQARATAAQTRAGIPPLEESIASAINQIDVLLGVAPGSSAQRLGIVAPVPAPPPIAGLGLPAELLVRRPDVLAAQHTLESEIIRIGVARADLYPALRLTGSIDTSSDSLGDLFETSVASLIGNITAPIFQGGQIRARIEQQKGSADTALANYRGTILVALQDVENALLSAAAARQREAALGDAEAAALQSLQLAEIRYRSGDIDFQTLLDVQRSLLSIQDSRASASAARSTAAVQLFKALGGGWNTAALP
ncbi:MAG: efflux transporter outer membrane subunit [Bacteroidales bacterium]|nr:efflux transporter outer membrane subunit [Bacteroidales bacterium]